MLIESLPSRRRPRVTQPIVRTMPHDHDSRLPLTSDDGRFRPSFCVSFSHKPAYSALRCSLENAFKRINPTRTMVRVLFAYFPRGSGCGLVRSRQVRCQEKLSERLQITVFRNHLTHTCDFSDDRVWKNRVARQEAWMSTQASAFATLAVPRVSAVAFRFRRS